MAYMRRSDGSFPVIPPNMDFRPLSRNADKIQTTILLYTDHLSVQGLGILMLALYVQRGNMNKPMSNPPRYTIIGGLPFSGYTGTVTFTGLKVVAQCNDLQEVKQIVLEKFEEIGGLHLVIDTMTGKEAVIPYEES